MASVVDEHIVAPETIQLTFFSVLDKFEVQRATFVGKDTRVGQSRLQPSSYSPFCASARRSRRCDLGVDITA
ncbi:hypothetical protein K437DRAFT_50296 [Tilletiaria anomala UBC 951]|uniref:Uncharacterized protein n=1 Tax=Tilletiaria anomala (strain ATCC 24038 / CBS 436.72 / UBC 951) TaxID=1037660 RepID=A0A066WCD8_TILAU|nr:uncharacterized protein K437DRAFT_50296 [Tilletiaria anomala UBC 951]KDN51391.1 hypothetical protein K437DRAFT_50296 [Tilletiaria anomala UBC 951]